MSEPFIDFSHKLCPFSGQLGAFSLCAVVFDVFLIFGEVWRQLDVAGQAEFAEVDECPWMPLSVFSHKLIMHH